VEYQLFIVVKNLITLASGSFLSSHAALFLDIKSNRSFFVGLDEIALLGWYETGRHVPGIWVVQKQTGENLKVVWAEFSSLILAVLVISVI
jgi:hypothetical protein